jgi:pyruvate dehydrogenase E1 component alpha subunit
MHRVIGERSLAETPFDEATARALFEGMVRARAFDERALALQRRGWMSGYPPFRGGEATQVAAARAMRDDDWLFPTYRANAMQLARGVPMADLLRFRVGPRREQLPAGGAHRDTDPPRRGRGDGDAPGRGRQRRGRVLR